MSEQLWIRVGDCGEYETFGDDLDALVGVLNELRVGTIDHWRHGGIETVNYWGNDYVSLYWGDAAGNLVRDLNHAERAVVETELEEVYI